MALGEPRCTENGRDCLYGGCLPIAFGDACTRHAAGDGYSPGYSGYRHGVSYAHPGSIPDADADV